MVLQKVGESDITVQSDADGYSEGVTVQDSDTVHVDSHAEATASGETVLMEIHYPDIRSGNDEYIDTLVPVIDPPAGTSDTIQMGGKEFDVTYDIRVNNMGAEGDPLSFVIDGSDAWEGNVNIGDRITKTFGSYTSLESLEIDADYGWIRIQGRVYLSTSASATIDSKSVVTDDIYK